MRRPPARRTILFLLVVLALSGVARAQAPSPPDAPPAFSAAELAAFQDLVDLWHTRACYLGGPVGRAGEGMLPLFVAVAARHGLTVPQVQDIELRSFEALYTTHEESLAFSDLVEEVARLPKDATRAQVDEAHARVAARNNLSVPRLILVEYLVTQEHW